MEFIEITLAIKPESEIEKELLSQWDPDLDVFVYSGDICDSLDKTWINIIEQKSEHSKVLLLLTTFGGDANAAFRTTRYLKRKYKKFTLGVLGDCKSAGTIMAFGADSIIMGLRGEFGPLDVQMFRPDEFVQRTSGMTISQALSYLSDRAFETFEDVFLAIRRRSGGIITTQTAAEIATSIVGSLYSPIAEKIDPMRIGEMQRSMDIAIHYGIRLGGDPDNVKHLAKNYPSHGFVIDIEEASYLFNDVRCPTDVEELIFTQIANVLKHECGHNYLATQNQDDDFAAKVIITGKIEEEEKDNADTGNPKEDRTQEGKSSPRGRKTARKKAGSGKVDSSEIQPEEEKN